MHRSGTSYVASLLRAGGVHLGERLLGPNAANVRGHFEDLDFTDLQGRMLAAHGVSSSGWTVINRAAIEDRFAPAALDLAHARSGHEVWGWKDPRNALFLDFWSALLPDARFVFVYRKPWEIVDSLFRRGDRDIADDPLLALHAWIEHNERMLRFRKAAPERAIFVHVEPVADDTPAFLRLIEEKLSVHVAHCRREIDVFEPAMIRLTGPGCFEEQMTRLCFPDACKLYNVLERNADLPAGELVSEDAVDPAGLALPLFIQWFGLRALEGNARMLRLRADLAVHVTPVQN